MTDCLIYH